MDIVALLGAALGLGFASGLRLYATVLIIGLGIHFKKVNLYPGLENLRVLDNPIILTAAGIAFLLEFFSDKIPWIDSLWDAIHTFIRPFGAAALAATAIASVDPVTRTTLAILSGGAALIGHSSKAGTRLVVNHSPEPLTNLGLSLSEDLLAVGLALAAVVFPHFMLTLAIGFVVIFLVVAPKLFRLLRIECAAFLSLLRGEPPWTEGLPDDYADFVAQKVGLEGIKVWVRCAAGSGIGGLRHSIGYLCLANGRLIFVTRRLFRYRTYEIPLEKIERLRHRKRLLLNRLSLIRYGSKKQSFYFFKNTTHRVGELMAEIRKAGAE